MVPPGINDSAPRYLKHVPYEVVVDDIVVMVKDTRQKARIDECISGRRKTCKYCNKTVWWDGIKCPLCNRRLRIRIGGVNRKFDE